MSRYVYPRLGRAVAHSRLEEIRQANAQGLHAVTALAAAEHSQAAPVATGGTRVTSEDLWRIRATVWDRISHWFEGGDLPRSQVGEFDRALGAALHEELHIVPGDAAHEGPWSFLSVVLLPDVVAARFPKLHADRALGTNRNALKRVWLRQEILGELHQAGDPPLGEDELVGIFERSALVRNRRLARQMARTVVSYGGRQARSDFARELYKHVRRLTGPALMDTLADTQIEEQVDRVAMAVTTEVITR